LNQRAISRGVNFDEAGDSVDTSPGKIQDAYIFLENLIAQEQAKTPALMRSPWVIAPEHGSGVPTEPLLLNS
jgi:hypothetical protein